MTIRPNKMPFDTLVKNDDTFQKEIENSCKALGCDAETTAATIKLSELHRSMINAPYCADDAAKVLRLAADYLRDAEKGKPLPIGLGSYLADAFEVSAAKSTPKERVQNLGHDLNLTSRNQRAVNPYNVGAYMNQFVQNGHSINAAADKTNDDLRVSESAATRSYKWFLETFAEHFKRLEEKNSLSEEERNRKVIENWNAFVEEHKDFENCPPKR